MRYIAYFSSNQRESLHVSVQALSAPDAQWAAEQFVRELAKRQNKRKPYKVSSVCEDEATVEHRADGSVWVRESKDEWERVA